MTTIYLSLGSNLGDRAENLRTALSKLAPKILVQKVSRVYETEPMYVEEQPEFLNAVAEATTELSASEVLQKLKSTEKEMGEHEHNRPRVIDLDLLFYGNQITDTPELKVPHPRIAERAFVLIPMADIAPEFLHPVSGLSIKALAERLHDPLKSVKEVDVAIFAPC